MTTPSEADMPPPDDFPTDSEQRLRLFIETVADYAIFTVDPNNRITTWNTGAERLLGWSESEAIGLPAEVVFTPEDRAAGEPEKEFRTAAETGSAADERIHIRKDGSRFWASWNAHGDTRQEWHEPWICQDHARQHGTAPGAGESRARTAPVRSSSRCGRKREPREGRIHIDRQSRASHTSE